jgi:hypothetical protein
VQQRDLTPDRWPTCCIKTDRDELLAARGGGQELQKTQATEQMVAACEELAR